MCFVYRKWFSFKTLIQVCATQQGRDFGIPAIDMKVSHPGSVVALNFIDYCVVPENIHTPPTEGFLVSIPHPSGNSSFVSYFLLKILACEISLPLGISNDPPRCG